MTALQQKLARLDAALTGKLRSVVEHTAERQHVTAESLLFGGNREYYLSDGGYSRIAILSRTRDGNAPKLVLTSNSLEQAKARWSRCHELIKSIEQSLCEYLKS